MSLLSPLVSLLIALGSPQADAGDTTVRHAPVENEAAESASEEAPELAAETTSLRAPETLGPTIETQPEIPPLEVPAAETAAPETAQTDTPPEEEESVLPASARRMRFHFEAS